MKISKSIFIGVTAAVLAVGLAVGGHFTYKHWDTIKGWFIQTSAEPVSPDEPAGDIQYLNYQISNGVILKYTGDESKITIPETYDVRLEGDQIKYIVGDKFKVESIGNSAFSRNGNLISITVGENIASIGSSAFNGCSNLEEVILSNSINEINDYTFSACSKLKNLTIPTSVTRVGDNVFSNSGIVSIDFPASVKSIGSYNFRFVTSLTAVTFNEGLESIGRYNFEGTKIQSLKLPNSLKEVFDSAFQGMKSLTKVSMGTGIESLPSQLFSQCSALTEFIIPNSVKSIAVNAFGGCRGLLKIFIPATVETLEVNSVSQGPFDSCNNVLKLFCEAFAKPEGWADGFLKSSYLDENNFAQPCVISVVYGSTLADYEAA